MTTNMPHCLSANYASWVFYSEIKIKTPKYVLIQILNISVLLSNCSYSLCSCFSGVSVHVNPCFTHFWICKVSDESFNQHPITKPNNNNLVTMTILKQLYELVIVIYSYIWVYSTDQSIGKCFLAIPQGILRKNYYIVSIGTK